MGPTAQYWVAVAALLTAGTGGLLLARRSPGRVATVVGRVISVVLLFDAVTCRWISATWRCSSPRSRAGSPARFPELQFVEFVVGHVGIVVAAGYLVIGVRREPRPGAVLRIFAVTVAYAVVVGVIDALTGANYMYLRHVPRHVSLLSELGPWPWYIASAAGLTIVLFAVLDLPFRTRRSRDADPKTPLR